MREALEEAGAAEALGEALEAAGVLEVPGDRGELDAFVEGPLLDALVGRVHPVTARAIADEVLERVRRAGSERSSERAPAQAATVPPPPPAGDEDAYEDLASGAVHTRATPAWGIRRYVEGGDPSPPVWLLVSGDEALLDAARRGAPAGTDVVEVSSMAVLKGGLARAGEASCVVLDAGSPSIPLDRAIGALTEDAATARILLWRMEDDARARLLMALPMARTWLACEAEVTPQEIVQLLGA